MSTLDISVENGKIKVSTVVSVHCGQSRAKTECVVPYELCATPNVVAATKNSIIVRGVMGLEYACVKAGDDLRQAPWFEWTAADNDGCIEISNLETTTYNVYYRTDDDEPWTIVNAASNEYTITELTSATEYTIDVTAICSDGTETGFTFAPSVVTATLCAPYPVPFTEDFTTFPATTSITSCWQKAKGFTNEALVYGSSFWGSQTKEGILLGQAGR